MTAPKPTTFVNLRNGERFQLLTDPGIGRTDWTSMVWLKFTGTAVHQDADLLGKNLAPDTPVLSLSDLDPRQLPDLSDPGVGFKGSWVLRGHEWAILKELILRPLLPASATMLWWRCEALIPLPGILRSRNRFQTALDAMQGKKLIVLDPGRHVSDTEAGKLREYYREAPDPARQELELLLEHRPIERYYRLTGYGILRAAAEKLILL
jgi:hypothetical protein